MPPIPTSPQARDFYKLVSINTTRIIFQLPHLYRPDNLEPALTGQRVRLFNFIPILLDAPFLFQNANLLRRHRMKPHGHIHRQTHHNSLMGLAVRQTRRIPRAYQVRKQRITDAICNLGQCVGAQRRHDENVRPLAQVDVQDAPAPRPRRPRLVLVLVDAVDMRKRRQRRDGGLLGGLAAEKVGGGLGEDDADGEVGVVAEGGDDVGQLDCCYGAGAVKC